MKAFTFEKNEFQNACFGFQIYRAPPSPIIQDGGAREITPNYWVAYGNPSRKMGRFLRFIFRVGKSLACHSPAKWCLCA